MIYEALFGNIMTGAKSITLCMILSCIRMLLVYLDSNSYSVELCQY